MHVKQMRTHRMCVHILSVMSILNPLAAAPVVARSFFTPPAVTSTGGAAAWFAAQRSDDWSDGAGRGDVDTGDIDTQRTPREDLATPIEALDGPLGPLDRQDDDEVVTVRRASIASVRRSAIGA